MSNGTRDGKVLIKDINTGTNDSFPHTMVELNNKLYFVADDGVNGYELWTAWYDEVIPGVTDTDNDGVVDSVESGSPLGMDVNNDSINDSQQSIVTTSFNDLAGAYTTAVIDNCSSGFTMFTNGPESRLAIQDAGYTYPLGLLNFTASCGVLGATANITQYFDKLYDTNTWTYRKYLPGTGFIDFTNQITYGTAVVNGITVTTVSFSITDGSQYDTDGLLDGNISDPLGPAVLAVASPSSNTSQILQETGSNIYVRLIFAIVLITFVYLLSRNKDDAELPSKDLLIRKLGGFSIHNAKLD